jgi:hypothetical protein
VIPFSIGAECSMHPVAKRVRIKPTTEATSSQTVYLTFTTALSRVRIPRSECSVEGGGFHICVTIDINTRRGEMANDQ